MVDLKVTYFDAEGCPSSYPNRETSNDRLKT